VDGLDSDLVVVAANLRDRDLGEQVLQDHGDGDVAQGDAFVNELLFTKIVNDKRVTCPSSSVSSPDR